MENLKDLPFGIALFLVGAIFLLLGLSGGFSAANYSLMLQEMWPRVIVSLVGAILIGFGIYVEVKLKSPADKPTSKKDADEQPDEPTELGAEAFFFTLDSSRAESFPDMVQGAVRVDILGRTMVNLLSQYAGTFEQLARSGCDIRLLLVDPMSEACKFLYGSSTEIYRSNIAATVSQLKRLRRVCGAQLEVKVIKHAPTSSIVVVEKPDLQRSFIQVQLYFLHGAVGWDRPVCRVNHGDKWYGVFQKEFNQLWSDGEEWHEARQEVAGPGEQGSDG